MSFQKENAIFHRTNLSTQNIIQSRLRLKDFANLTPEIHVTIHRV